MDNSIRSLIEQVNKLRDSVETFRGRLEHHVIKEPRARLYDALRCGFPEDIYSYYLNSYLTENEGFANDILYDIDNDFIPYLRNVEYHLCNAANVGAGTSATTPQRGLSNTPHNAAIDKNYKDLEKALGIKRGTYMSISEADKQNANPNYYDGYEYHINCATCAAAYTLRLKGFNVKAKGNPVKEGNKNTWLSECHSFDIWNNADGTKATPTHYEDWMKMKGLAEMTPDDYKSFFEEHCKEQGVYIVTVAWKDGGGHATVLQRDADGKLYYIEPQLFEADKTTDGRRSLDDLVYNMAPVQPSEKGIMRVDNKLFDTDYADLFEKY